MKVRVRRQRQAWRRYARRPDRSWHQRVWHEARHLKPGTVIETCSCDVARVIFTDESDVEYVSLTTGMHGSCNIIACAPVPLRPAAIARRLQLFKEGGKRALTMRYYTEDCQLTPEAAVELAEKWEPEQD